jgi:hypothetical protein
MGLFINNKKHPEVYKNLKLKNENNQEVHRKDYLEELLNSQQKTNLSLSQSLEEIKVNNHQQKEWHTNQWNDVKNQLNDIEKKEFEHHNFDLQIMERLKRLEEKQKTFYSFMEEETKLKLEVMNEMETQNRISQEISKRIEHFEVLTQQLTGQIMKQQENMNEKIKQQEGFQTEVLSRLDNHEKVNQHLSEQIKEQINLEKELTEKISQQATFQTEILTRIDNQEALTEKLARQINHIRSTLFERTNFLAEKIEDGYQLTSSYVYKLLTGSEKPLTFYTLKNKQGDHQKHTD